MTVDHGIETDIAAAASAGAFVARGRAHAAPPGTPCYNCATPLRGGWCHACGQRGEDFHRSAHHLVWEALEGLFHADGRLWQTVPRLLFDPASLTRDYLAGRRAPQVPPLRLFFVVLLIVFVAGSIASSGTRMHLANMHLPPEAMKPELLGTLKVSVYAPWDAAITEWIRTHVGRAVAHPNDLLAAMGAWLHDFAFLTLPLSALLLSALFVFRRGFVMFDHCVFSMHSLSFQGLLFTAVIGTEALVGSHGSWLLWVSPVHLFAHMRGVYRTSIVGTLFRMAVLFVASVVILSLLVAGLVLLGLEALQQ